MSIFAKAKKARENKKGFTLVELIVVLVILAILAAMLVPALLGWIDEARNKQYVLEARSIYVATQAVNDELYATDKPPIIMLEDINDDSMIKITDLSDVSVTKIRVTKTKTNNPPRGSAYTKEDYTITEMHVEFSSNGKNIVAELTGSDWKIIGIS